MTDADGIMNPQHFGRDPADIRLRIYPGSLLVEILALVEVLRSPSTFLFKYFLPLKLNLLVGLLGYFHLAYIWSAYYLQYSICTKRRSYVPLVSTCFCRLQWESFQIGCTTTNKKNLAIANWLRVSCAHNTLRALTGLNITPWPWSLG